MKTTCFIVALALSLTACSGDFTEPFEVDGPRIMGSRLEPEGAPEHAWPEVGQKFNLRWLIARPDAPKSNIEKDQQITAAVAVCAGVQLPTGQLFCAQEIDVTPENNVTSMDELVMPLSVPFDPRPFGSSQILLFGGFCSDSQVERIAGTQAGKDPTSKLYRCRNASGKTQEALAFTTEINVDFADDNLTNQNPSFACDPDDEGGICEKGTVQEGEERRGGPIVLVKPKAKDARAGATRSTVAWEPTGIDPIDLPFEDCASDSNFTDRTIHVGDDAYTIRIRFDPSDRERYEFQTVVESKKVLKKEREELLVATASTKGLGQLDRYFSLVPRNAPDDEAEVEVDFKPPGKNSEDGKMVPKGGKLVRFYFVVRDQRGGADFTTRELCLVPGK